MRCLKLTVAVALVLCVLANVQCVARCAVTPCDQSSTDLPPCHRHSNPAPKACVSPLFVSDARSHGTHQLVVQATLADAEPAAPVLWQPLALPYPPSPPRDERALSVPILRI